MGRRAQRRPGAVLQRAGLDAEHHLGHNIVWGNNIIWGNNIVWDDNIIWGNNIVWGNT